MDLEFHSEERELESGNESQFVSYGNENSQFSSSLARNARKNKAVMRLYIRNKEKYDPSKAGKVLVFVEFPDPRVFSVGQVKEVSLGYCSIGVVCYLHVKRTELKTRIVV